MTYLSLAVFVGTAFIMLIEGIMWLCFRTRHAGINFPREVDTSFFRFFTYWRMFALVACHTIFLVVMLIFSFHALW